MKAAALNAYLILMRHGIALEHVSVDFRCLISALPDFPKPAPSLYSFSFALNEHFLTLELFFKKSSWSIYIP